MVELKASVDRWMLESFLAPWQAYLHEKDTRGELVQIDNVFVDVPNVMKPYTCDATTCSRGLRPKGARSCCGELTAEITPPEVERIRSFFPELSAFLAERDPHWAKLDPTLDACIGENAYNPFQLELQKRKKRCVFSFLNEDGAIYCGIHGLALETGQNVFKMKPKLCFLFPLMVQDLTDGTYLLSVLDEENAALIGFNDYERLPCLHGDATFDPDENPAPPFYADHRSTLSHLFSKGFVKKLDKLARELGVDPEVGPRPDVLFSALVGRES